MQKWRSAVVVALSALMLSGCAALAPSHPGGKSSPTASASPSASSSASAKTKPTASAPLVSWRLGKVEFKAPNWLASPAADYGIQLWGSPLGNVTLAHDSGSEVMVVQVAAAGQSSSGATLTADLTNDLILADGSIANGPVVGSVSGDRTDTYLIKFDEPGGLEDNGLVAYWFSKQGDVALFCGWSSTNIGANVQNACRATLASFKDR